MRRNNLGINELYSFAIERCSFLMENSKYRVIILADDDRIKTLAKGYFQGFYEALQMIAQKNDSAPISSPSSNGVNERKGE